MADHPAIYRDYIDCLNRRDWPALGGFVCDELEYNDRPMRLADYQAMLEQNVREIPDLWFDIRLLVCEGAHVAGRLQFDCTPTASFLGLAIDGRRVSFAENAFYEMEGGKIRRVWSVVDKAAIEAQL